MPKDAPKDAPDDAPEEKEEDENRCLTGIDGLDNILNGGIPRGHTVLLSGGCGTGKTSLGLEFLIHGALGNEPGVFISASEGAEDILSAMIPYEFFSDEILKKGKLVFVDLATIYERLGLQKTEFDFEDLTLLVSTIQSVVKELSAKRMVIDSITSICDRMKTQERMREFLMKLSRALSEDGCTSLLISETPSGEKSYSLFGVEEDIVDGVIHLGNFERGGDRLRTLQVIKMRGTVHSMAKYIFDLTTCGLLLVPLLKGGG